MGVHCLIFSGNSSAAYNSNNVAIRQLSAGAYRLATELRKASFTTQVVDFSREKTFSLIHKLILSKFVDKETLWIGFSNNFIDYILDYPHVTNKKKLEWLKTQNQDLGKELKKFIAYARNLNPDVQFVIGGTRLIDLADLNFYEFRGYADTQIISFTKALSAKKVPKQKIYNFEIYEDFVTSQIRYEPRDILNYYKGLSVEISRGCIFKCKFCAHPLNGKTKGEWIKHSDVLKDEFIYNYENYGIKDYVFADDTYNDSCTKVETLYDKVFSKLPFQINFVTYLRLDLLKRYPHTVDILKNSGLTAGFFGLETLNPVAAKIIGKGACQRTLIEFAEKLKQSQFSNINMQASWILGLPTDTESKIIEMCEWIVSDKNPFDSNSFAELGVKPSSFDSTTVFKSPFDEDIFKYNLDVYYDDQYNLEWKYTDTNLQSAWCRKQALFFRNIEINQRRRLPTFIYPDLVTLGVTKDDYTGMSPKDFFQKYDLISIQKNMNKKYIQNLLMT